MGRSVKEKAIRLRSCQWMQLFYKTNKSVGARVIRNYVDQSEKIRGAVRA